MRRRLRPCVSRLLPASFLLRLTPLHKFKKNYPGASRVALTGAAHNERRTFRPSMIIWRAHAFIDACHRLCFAKGWIRQDHPIRPPRCRGRTSGRGAGCVDRHRSAVAGGVLPCHEPDADAASTPTPTATSTTVVHCASAAGVYLPTPSAYRPTTSAAATATAPKATDVQIKVTVQTN